MTQVQNIKPGYKLTELGVIPEDWIIGKFLDIADKRIKWSITGGPFGSNLKKEDYTEEGIQIIQLQNIGDGQFIDDNQVYTSLKKAKELLSCNIYPNELILSKMGDPVARACFMPNKSERYLMASDGIRVVVDEKRFSKKFIHDYINSNYFRKRAFAVSTGSTRLRIGLPELKDLLIVRPHISEQSAIATILSDTDILIEHLDTLIEKKKSIKLGTMQQLLTGKKRLSGFSGEWVEKRLGDLAQFYKGRGLPKSDILLDGEHKCIHYGELFTTYQEEIHEVKSKTNKFEDVFLSRKNDVLMPTSDVTPNGLAKASCINEDSCILGGDVLVIRCDIGFMDGIFLAYSIRFDKKQIMQLVSGSTVYHLYGSDMKKFEIKIPPTIKEQIAIVKVLGDMDKEINDLESKRDKYKNIKQGMMQQLLTGNIRVYAN